MRNEFVRTLVVLIIMVLISAVALTLGAENDQLLQVNYLLARGERNNFV